MSDDNENKKTQQNLLRVAKILASKSDLRASEPQRVSLAKLDAALSGMEFSERIFIKKQLARAGVVFG